MKMTQTIEPVLRLFWTQLLDELEIPNRRIDKAIRFIAIQTNPVIYLEEFVIVPTMNFFENGIDHSNKN